MALIEVKALSIGYNKAIMENVSFEVNEGDYLLIVGENGAGKSTLLMTILGLIPKLQGEIDLKDGKLGYLPQRSGIDKDFPASVREVVLSGNMGKLKNRAFYTDEDKENTEKNMQRMNITHLANKPFRNLSGGQQQRVLLARALCASEDLLLMDEPVKGLDPQVKEDFYKLILELHKEGRTIVMITHDIEEVLENATHVLHIGEKKRYFGESKDYPYEKFWGI